MIKYLFTYLLFLLLVLPGCSSSVSDRYERENANDKAIPKDSAEDFDITPYRTEIIVAEPETSGVKKDSDIWYGYSDYDSTQIVVSSVNAKKYGYRVQVLSTDNFNEAKELKSEIYFKTNQKNVYVVFDPPFYKIKVGDFINLSDANQLNFKLNQMGYNESKVVKDSVNILQ